MPDVAEGSALNDDWLAALRFLNSFAEADASVPSMFLPGLDRVQASHRGLGGWVRLTFLDIDGEKAFALARLLLLPEPEPVLDAAGRLCWEGVPGEEPPTKARPLA